MTFFFWENYMRMCIFINIGIIVAVLLVSISNWVSPLNSNNEKLSSYECGFEPFDEARKTFDIHYYVVALLFLIFDLEVAFLIPWSISFSYIGYHGLWGLLAFIYMLALGFGYEWGSGALEWSLNLKKASNPFFK